MCVFAWAVIGAPPPSPVAPPPAALVVGRGHEVGAAPPSAGVIMKAGAVGKTPAVTKAGEPEMARLIPAAERRMRLVVKDADVRDVLRLIAETGEVNLAVGDEVKGKVTMRLEDVSWTDAFHAVLRTRQLGFERQGDILLVETLDRMTHRAEQRARTLLSSKEAAPLVTALVPVRFAKAEDLMPVVRSLLSARGTVAVDKRTNTLIVTDVAAEEIRARLVL